MGLEFNIASTSVNIVVSSSKVRFASAIFFDNNVLADFTEAYHRPQKSTSVTRNGDQQEYFPLFAASAVAYSESIECIREQHSSLIPCINDPQLLSY